MLNDEAREAARLEAREAGRRTFARENAPVLAVVADEVLAARRRPGHHLDRRLAATPACRRWRPAQTLIDAVTQLEANKKDVTPRGFQKRLQLAYAIYDQAAVMMQEIETQHAKLVTDLVSVDRRSPLPQRKPVAK
jgi:hypothetical protein